MKYLENETYWNIDNGGQSWFSELSERAKSVVEFRLGIPTDEDGRLIAQYGWRFTLHGNNMIDRLVFDPHRLTQKRKTAIVYEQRDMGDEALIVGFLPVLTPQETRHLGENYQLP